MDEEGEEESMCLLSNRTVANSMDVEERFLRMISTIPPDVESLEDWWTEDHNLSMNEISLYLNHTYTPSISSFVVCETLFVAIDKIHKDISPIPVRESIDRRDEEERGDKSREDSFVVIVLSSEERRKRNEHIDKVHLEKL